MHFHARPGARPGRLTRGQKGAIVHARRKWWAALEALTLVNRVEMEEGMKAIPGWAVGPAVAAQRLLYRLRPKPVAQPRYVTSPPSPQNALDILRGEWVCQLPPPFAHLEAGELTLFDDARIHWLVEETGGVEGQTVLELGPLEGAHAAMLEQYGAAHVTAIEANTHAYLKCLIVKEILGLQRVEFLCGDLVEYLRQPDGPSFDLCVASGVLYHMQNPAEVIALLATRCRGSLFLWTHYYDAAWVAQNPWVAHKLRGQTAAEHAGFRHTLYRYEYQEARHTATFSGAGRPASYWMARDELLACVEHFGFERLRIAFDEPAHQGGPALALLAQRQA
jgi:SAM-dependent methyltransferase